MAENWNGVNVRYDLLPIGTRRTGQKLNTGKPVFGVVHDTGNPNTTAQQNVNYYKNTYMEPWASVSSAHIFIDDKECIITIPVTEKAWHVLYNATTDNAWYGVDANDGAFGVEISYFTSGSNARARSRKALDNACRVLAYLCKYWGINPRTHLPGHQDIQSDKVDPGNLLQACGYNRRDMTVMDNLIVKYMNGTVVKPKVIPTAKKGGSAKPVKKPASAPKKVTQTNAWRVNASGVTWKPEVGTFTVTAKKGIITRQFGGSRKYPVAEGLKYGTKKKYFEVIAHDGFIWLAYKTDSGKVAYCPIAQADKKVKTKRVGDYWVKLGK